MRSFYGVDTCSLASGRERRSNEADGEYEMSARGLGVSGVVVVLGKIGAEGREIVVNSNSV